MSAVDERMGAIKIIWPAATYVVIYIYLVRNQHARDIGTVFPQLLVPVGQVLIRDLSSYVEYQDATVRAVII
jgi:hypothetical protein